MCIFHSFGTWSVSLSIFVSSNSFITVYYIINDQIKEEKLVTYKYNSGFEDRNNQKMLFLSFLKKAQFIANLKK